MDLHTEEVLHSRSLDATQSMLAVNRLREVLPEVTFAVERIGAGRRADVEFGREPTYVPRWPTPDHPPLAPVEELVAEGGVIKILARIPQAEHAAIDGDDDRPAHARALGPDPTRNIPAAPLVDALLAKAAAALVGVASVTHSNPNDTLLEVSALGATKAVALATHVESLGVASHAVVAWTCCGGRERHMRWPMRIRRCWRRSLAVAPRFTTTELPTPSTRFWDWDWHHRSSVSTRQCVRLINRPWCQEVAWT